MSHGLVLVSLVGLRDLVFRPSNRSAEATFRKRPRSAAHGWWPEFDFRFGTDEAAFSWSVPQGSFNSLQKKLKQGTRWPVLAERLLE